MKSLLFSFYLVVAFMAIVIYDTPKYLGIYWAKNQVTLSAFLYLYLMLFIFFTPILRFDMDHVKKFVFPNTIFANYLVKFFFLISTVLIICMIPIFLSSLTGDYAESYKNIRNGEADYVYPRWISWIFNFYNIMFPVGLLYFFYMLVLKKSLSKIYIIVYILCLILPNFFHGVITASRGALFFSFFNLVLGFAIFKNFLNSSLKKLVYVFFITFITVFVVYAAAITVSRFGEKNSPATPIDAVFSYFGEPFLNFDMVFWDQVKKTTYGERLFPGVTNFIGISDVDLKMTSGERSDIYYRKTGVPVHLFKTLPGDFYVDFGLLGSIILAIIISVMGCVFIRMSRKDTIQFHTLLLYFFYYQVCIYGVFDYTQIGIRGIYNYSGLLLLYFFFRFDFKKGLLKPI
ncbi:O-antigen polymerase [Daejeonia sp. YH14]|uniref:O-antigen polymerase n=1 Tax=Daejeonia sp. YH14 TaxID=3439042 RepID=UPI003F499B78